MTVQAHQTENKQRIKLIENTIKTKSISESMYLNDYCPLQDLQY